MSDELEYSQQCQECGYTFKQIFSKIDQETTRECPQCDGRVCWHCKQEIENQRDVITCYCHEEGYTNHDESVWCSNKCMNHDHPEPIEPDLEGLETEEFDD